MAQRARGPPPARACGCTLTRSRAGEATMSNVSGPPQSRLNALYTRWVRAADWAHAHRAAVRAAGAPLVVLALVAINQLVLLDFPNSGDEYAYLYQARTMATGRLWNAPIAPAGVFALNYIVQEPGRAYGSFPVGWPLALAAVIRVGVPPWLLAPVLGALTLGLVWHLGSRLYSPRVGVSAAALVAISPFFLFNGASYFSHTFCGALLLGAACLAARVDRRPTWVPLAAGLLIGWAVLARYFTGVVCAVPIAYWLLRPGVARPRTAALVVLGGLPWVLLLAWYNTMLSGSPWHLTTRPLTFSLWFADRFMLRGADILAARSAPPDLGAAGALVAYLMYLRSAARDPARAVRLDAGAARRVPLLLRRARRQPIRAAVPLRGVSLHGRVRGGGTCSAALALEERLLVRERALFGMIAVGGHHAAGVRRAHPDRAARDPRTHGSVHDGVCRRSGEGSGAHSRPRRLDAVDGCPDTHAQRNRLRRRRALRTRPGRRRPLRDCRQVFRQSRVLVHMASRQGARRADAAGVPVGQGRLRV